MLVKDFIIETPQENRELLSLASAILWNWKKNPRREVAASDVDTSDITQPAIQELTKFLKIKFDAKFDRSLYNPRTKEILVKHDKLDVYSLKSVIVHELQHALDDFKSQGKFTKEKGNYWSRQSEVNARLTQAINDIESALQKIKLKNVDWNNPKIKTNIIKLINSYLKIHKLSKGDLDDKRYQRLVSRIYNYLTAR